MPVDKENIKRALDAFESDEYVDAKDILKKEIRTARNEYLGSKLKLKNDIEPKDDDLDSELDSEDLKIDDEVK